MARFSFSLLALTVLAAPAAWAFMPPSPSVASRSTVSVSASSSDDNMTKLSRTLSLLPAVLAGLTGVGAVVAPQPALADGSVSMTTTMRASAIYGPRVINLKTAVEKGDFAAIKKEEGAIRLFNSGAFALNRPLKQEVQSCYAEVAKAVEAKDAAALKTSWAKYFKTAGLDKTNPFSKDDVGQAYSTEFTYTHSSPLFDPRVGGQ